MKQRRVREKLECLLSFCPSSFDIGGLQEMSVELPHSCTCSWPRILRSQGRDQAGAGGAAGLVATLHGQGEPGDEGQGVRVAVRPDPTLAYGVEWLLLQYHSQIAPTFFLWPNLSWNLRDRNCVYIVPMYTL